MEGVHIAHDDIVGNGCIIGNCTKLAGEVNVDDNAILSACVLVHQFCRIGSYTMVSGGTRSSQSIMPYSICAREPATYCGLNIVGLRPRDHQPYPRGIPHHLPGRTDAGRRRGNHRARAAQDARDCLHTEIHRRNQATRLREIATHGRITAATMRQD